MRVFVTGATGFIGTAVVSELRQAGHTVQGLARSAAAAVALTAAGAEVVTGSLDDLASLTQGAVAADGVLHLAYNYDFAQAQAAVATDEQAIRALGSGLVGTTKPLVVATGLAGVAPGRVAREDQAAEPGQRRSEPAALALAAQGVRAMVVRLAPSVHDQGDHGFVAYLLGLARLRGWPPTWETARTAGRPCTAWMRPACFGWRSSGARPVPATTA